MRWSRDWQEGNTVFGKAAAAPEHGPIEEADEEGHEHAREVVGGRSPIAQPVLARQRHKLRAPVRAVGALEAQPAARVGCPLRCQPLHQRRVVPEQLACLRTAAHMLQRGRGGATGKCAKLKAFMAQSKACMACTGWLKRIQTKKVKSCNTKRMSGSRIRGQEEGVSG